LEIICWEGQNIQRIEVVAPEEEEGGGEGEEEMENIHCRLSRNREL
jgi:hypothetical protein